MHHDFAKNQVVVAKLTGAFADVFQQAFLDARASIVNNLKIEIPLIDGIDLVDAAGYPISRQKGQAVFYPGSMYAGQTRKLYLTLRVPTNRNRQFELGNLKVFYHHDNQVHETTLEDSLKIACVQDQRKVYSSIDETRWSDKVINDDFNEGIFAKHSLCCHPSMMAPRYLIP